MESTKPPTKDSKSPDARPTVGPAIATAGPGAAGSVEDGVPLALGVTPGGHVHVFHDAAFGRTLPRKAAEGIEKAFAAGTGFGILHLGAVETARELGPTAGYWRDLGKLHITKLCALLDLDAAVMAGLEIPLEADEASRFLATAPPMIGGEYLSEIILREAWDGIGRAFLEEVRSSGRDAESYLKACNPLWSTVGRVFFHLAENKARADLPFAFLATYTSRVSSHGKVQHVPFGRAVKEQAAAADTRRLLALLAPVQRAAEDSPFLRELVDSGRIFHPQAWPPADAHRFLRDVPRFEEKGIFVRIPDWWSPRSPPRIRVGVTVGGQPAAGLGANALLDFSVDLSLDGEKIGEEEWRRILAGTDGLALVKGRWVEVDREKLTDLLRQWKAIELEVGQGGLSFREGLRLLAGLPGNAAGDRAGLAAPGDPASGWLKVDSGQWLRDVLEELKSPSGEDSMLPGDALRTTLRPYQADGVKWLWLLHRLRLGGCLADDMGLGKTVQVIALLLMLRREARSGGSGQHRPALLVIPASLIGNWKSECARFAPDLKLLVAHASEPSGVPTSSPIGLDRLDLVVTTYGMVARQEWLKATEWGLVVLDEAQAIKNPSARQTHAVKSLRSLHRLALTGTPVENRLMDLWSLFDFLDQGLLGSARDFVRLTTAEGGAAAEVYARIRSLVKPYLLRRLKTDRRIITDLPDKQEMKVFCGLRKTQAVLYQRSVEELARLIRDIDGMRRRGAILAFLLRFKQICNHPSQWTGDGSYDPAESGKFSRLLELCEEIASRQEKALVFTQFKEMTAVLAGAMEKVFGGHGLILDGDTPVKKRKDLVDAFQSEDGPPFFVLSLKAGGTGLNLTAASHVIHFDRWWNPAVENQATDRAFRIGQKKNVLVHKFICQGTVEEKIDALLESKQGMSDEVLKDGAEGVLTEMDNEELMRFVSMDRTAAITEN